MSVSMTSQDHIVGRDQRSALVHLLPEQLNPPSRPPGGGTSCEGEILGFAGTSLASALHRQSSWNEPTA